MITFNLQLFINIMCGAFGISTLFCLLLATDPDIRDDVAKKAGWLMLPLFLVSAILLCMVKPV